MSIWASWVIGISVGLIAIAFVVLVIFLICTLVSVRKTLSSTDRVLKDTAEIAEEVEKKIHAFDPYFNILSSMGGTLEDFASARAEKTERKMNTGLAITEWALVGLSLFEKIRQRWR